MPDERHEFKFKRVVQIPLPIDYAEEKVSYLVNLPPIYEILQRWASDGYSFSLSKDFKRDKCSASLFGKNTIGKNGGLMLYANAPTAMEAVEVLFVKHFLVALEGEWSDHETTNISAYS